MIDDQYWRNPWCLESFSTPLLPDTDQTPDPLLFLLQRGETAKAKWQYEKILGKALMGRGPAEHWAHSEYAWISFTEGDLQVRPEYMCQI